MMASQDLIVHLAQFAGALRHRGVEIGIADEMDGTRSLTLIDLADRDEVARALRIAFKVRRRDWATFDEVFDRIWTASPSQLPDVKSTAPQSNARGLARNQVAVAAGTNVVPGPSSQSDEGAPGYSPDVLLRKKPFDQCSAGDLAAMEQLLGRLARSLAVRQSRRLVPTRRRGITDLRRSFRRSIATGGELVSLAYRRRAIELPQLVVLCDTSGSMDKHARFLLAFVVALKRVARRTEIFVFNTSLTRITSSIASGEIARTVERLAAGVPDWSGGTKIGESLNKFVAQYLEQCVTHKSVVIIFSDGLDRGDTTMVSTAMRAIRSRARRVIWLNPLAGDSRYEPTARAMAAALPFVDRLAPAHDLESLERLLPELAA
jgi:uncharacterized protein with von Willebrand factor type A (vWA) domain